MTSSLVVIFLALAASPASAGVGIGQTGQGNEQGTNSIQSAVAGGAGGDNSIIGDAASEVDQKSGNTGVDVEAMGTGDGTMISNGPGATQFNQSATNSLQVGENGASGSGIFGSAPMLFQNATNLTVSAELMAVADAVALIGGNAQTSSTAVNSSQSANNFTGGGVGPFDQNSTNILISAIILARPRLTSLDLA